MIKRKRIRYRFRITAMRISCSMNRQAWKLHFVCYLRSLRNMHYTIFVVISIESAFRPLNCIAHSHPDVHVHTHTLIAIRQENQIQFILFCCCWILSRWKTRCTLPSRASRCAERASVVLSLAIEKFYNIFSYSTICVFFENMFFINE